MHRKQSKRTKTTSRASRPKISPLTKLFQTVSPCVVAFISKLQKLPAGTPAVFPQIFGTGFIVSEDGTTVTNRHVVEIFDQVPKHPRTGEIGFAALMFLPGEQIGSMQMVVVDIRAWDVLGSFTSSDRWFGQAVPDIGFVRLGVREVPRLQFATEDFYLQVGMDIATIGFPLGTIPLTAFGTINQVSPFLRHGVVSSVFPFPVANPHGFTIDVMQQGGSSGSPILRLPDGRVVGMMSSGIIEWKIARSDQASLAYSLNTNISIAEPAGIIEQALVEYAKHSSVTPEQLPTLAELKARYPFGSVPDDLTWESWPIR